MKKKPPRKRQCSTTGQQRKESTGSHESLLTGRIWVPIAEKRPSLRDKLNAFINIQEVGPLSNDAVRSRLVSLDQVLHTLETTGWKAEASAEVLTCLFDHPECRLEALELWLRSHEQDDHEAVCACIALIPPHDIRIIRRLPTQGSQKVVFEASWGLYQKTVVLKRLLAPDNILPREMQSFPLTNEHPNIVKTYTLSNGSETFLVEEKIQTLFDNWRSHGTEQTALLLHDIASALCYLDEKGLVHGDIKPDNIGIDQGRFILLDFGLCRPSSMFSRERSATGSLRTRAPELLVGEETSSSRSDVWALGASVSDTAGAGFPLIDPGEHVPRISEPNDRTIFEAALARRVKEEYEQRKQSVLAAINDSRLRQVLERMLDRNPLDRIRPQEIVRLLSELIPHAVPEPSGISKWGMSVEEEANCILAMWPTPEALAQVPNSQHEKLVRRTRELATRLEGKPALSNRLKALTGVT